MGSPKTQVKKFLSPVKMSDAPKRMGAAILKPVHPLRSAGQTESGKEFRRGRI